MSHLEPCPVCWRHVRVHERACPFCRSELALSDVPPPIVPRSRLGRAATFAFGATLVGASALASCSDEDVDTRRRGQGGSAGHDQTAGRGGSGADAGTENGGAGGSTAGQGGETGDGSAGAGGACADGGCVPIYGSPPF